MADPIKSKTNRGELGCTTILVGGYLAFIVIVVAYEYFHPKPPMTSTERAEFWQEMLAHEAEHARDCEKNIDASRRVMPDMLKRNRDWQDVRRSCWDEWREMQRRDEEDR
jgi:hypothetical protein